MNKLILVDLDETVLQFSDDLQAFLVTKGYVIKERMRDFHNIPDLFNLDLPTTLELIKEFHRSPAMGQLKPEPCAAEVLPALYKKGYQFVAITACLDEPEVYEMRVKNLEEAFGFKWEAVHCIGLKMDKTEYLELYPPAVWVEDMWHHAVSGAAAGHRSFIVDRPYNRGNDHPDVTRAVDWHEIADHLAREAWEARWCDRAQFV